MAAAESGVYFTLITGLSVLSILMAVFGVSIFRYQRRNIREYKNRVQREIAAVESDRRRIAADLHDDLGASVAAVRLGVEDLNEKLPGHKPGISTLAVLDKSLFRLREISHNLMPAILHSQGLNAAIQELCDEINLTGKVRIVFSSDCIDRSFKAENAIHLYRVFQEIIGNTLKHAKASTINANMTLASEIVILDISDNGIGFNPKTVPRQKSFGLDNIKSRIELLNARMTLHSGIGKGTAYHIRIPITAMEKSQ